MAYREKYAWISLVTWLVGYGFYFVMVARTLASGGSQAGLIAFPAIAGFFGAMLEAWLQRGVSRRELEQPDERERMVAARSSEIAFQVLLAIILMAGIAAMVGNKALSGLSLAEPGYSILNAAMLLIVLSGMVRFAAQIVLFRRGRA